MPPGPNDQRGPCREYLRLRLSEITGFIYPKLSGIEYLGQPWLHSTKVSISLPAQIYVLIRQTLPSSGIATFEEMVAGSVEAYNFDYNLVSAITASGMVSKIQLPCSQKVDYPSLDGAWKHLRQQDVHRVAG